MNHSYFRDRISAFFDNELSPQEKEIVERHLAQCQECQNLLAELKQLEHIVEKQSQLAGEDYWEQSAQRIEQRLGFAAEDRLTDITPSRWRGLVPKLAAVAASIAVLSFIALYEKEISKDVGLSAPEVAAPSLVMPDSETLGAATTGTKVAAERQKETKLQAGKTTVMISADETAESAKVKEETATVSDMLQSVEGVAAGRSGEVIGEPTPEKSVVSFKVATPESAERYVDLKEPARVSSERQETAGVGPAPTISPPDTGLTIPTDWPAEESLEMWRRRKDSLQTVYANLSSPHRTLSAAKSRRKISKPAARNVEELMLYAYYRIACLTDDPQEQTAAVNFLAAYAQEAESCCQAQAQRYLELLKRNRH